MGPPVFHNFTKEAIKAKENRERPSSFTKMKSNSIIVRNVDFFINYNMLQQARCLNKSQYSLTCEHYLMFFMKDLQNHRFFFLKNDF